MESYLQRIVYIFRFISWQGEFQRVDHHGSILDRKQLLPPTSANPSLNFPSPPAQPNRLTSWPSTNMLLYKPFLPHLLICYHSCYLTNPATLLICPNKPIAPWGIYPFCCSQKVCWLCLNLLSLFLCFSTQKDPYLTVYIGKSITTVKRLSNPKRDIFTLRINYWDYQGCGKFVF